MDNWNSAGQRQNPFLYPTFQFAIPLNAASDIVREAVQSIGILQSGYQRVTAIELLFRFL